MVRFGGRHGPSSKHENEECRELLEKLREEHTALLEKLHELQEEHSDAEQNVALRKTTISSLEEQLTQERAEREELARAEADLAARAGELEEAVFVGICQIFEGTILKCNEASRAGELKEVLQRARASAEEARTEAASQPPGAAAACEYAAALSDAALLREELRGMRGAEGRAEARCRGLEEEAAQAAGPAAEAQAARAAASASGAEARAARAHAAAEEAEAAQARREVSALQARVQESKDGMTELRALLSEVPEFPEIDYSAPAAPRQLAEMLEMAGEAVSPTPRLSEERAADFAPAEAAAAAAAGPPAFAPAGRRTCEQQEAPAAPGAGAVPVFQGGPAAPDDTELRAELGEVRLRLEGCEGQARQLRGELAATAGESMEAGRCASELLDQVARAEAAVGACRGELSASRAAAEGLEAEGAALQGELLEATEGEEAARASAELLRESAAEARASAAAEREQAEALREGLESELASHLAMASAASGAWSAHAGLQEEAASARAALASSEAGFQEELAESGRRADAAEEALERQRSRSEAAAGAEAEAAAVAGRLREELSRAASGGSAEAALEELTGERCIEMAMLRAELDDARFEVEIASEAAAEGSGEGEPLGMREATRARRECLELRSQLQRAEVGGSPCEAADEPGPQPDGRRARLPPPLGLDSSGLGVCDGDSVGAAAPTLDTPNWGRQAAGTGNSGEGGLRRLSWAEGSDGARDFTLDADGVAGPLADLRRELQAEVQAAAQAREEAAQESRACAVARATGQNPQGGSDLQVLADEAARLRQALSEESAKSRRLGLQALRAEESRRQLLQKLAEDAEAEADLQALAKDVGRAAKAIATISKEASREPSPEAQALPASALRSAASAGQPSSGTAAFSHAPAAPDGASFSHAPAAPDGEVSQTLSFSGGGDDLC